MPVTLLLLSVYLTGEKPITVEVVAMENPAGPSESTTDSPKSTMPMQGKISLYHYLMLTTNQLKLCGNWNVGVQLSTIIEDIRSSYPELVVESVVSEKSFAVVRQSDMNTICSAGPIYNPRMVISVDDQGHAQMEFQVFFRTMLKEAYSRQAADPHLESMLRESGYSVCPGIPE